MPTPKLDSRFSAPEADPTPWSDVEGVLASELYWLSTVRADGRPHVTPLIGVLIDDAMHFCTGLDEQKGRNLAHNPCVAITTGNNTWAQGLDVVIEGQAARVTDRAALQRVADAFAEKYGSVWHYGVGDGVWWATATITQLSSSSSRPRRLPSPKTLTPRPPSGSERARPQRLSLASARRIALAAQGFGGPRPARPPSVSQLATLIGRLGVLQLDSVNVFLRAHYMPVFSRLGPYDRSRLDRIAGHGNGKLDRRLVEYWAHEASLIPLELHPLLRWRMADVDREAWGSISRIAREQPELVSETLELVAERGPIRARDTGAVRLPLRPGHMWNWHQGKVALEHLFFTGQIAAARRVNFERLYDTTERVVPAAIRERPTPPREDAQRELVRVAARALGVATEPDLGDYFRLPRAASKARVAELESDGELIPVQVEGWAAPAYLRTQARRPRKLHARALLSPFDSLIWFRQRTERLFGFRYRIEIYTPAAKRVHGYYVLPFLLGDALVARVDLKSDRQRGALLVQGAFAEEGVDRAHVATELAAELRLVATWLGLDEVSVASRGDLSTELAAAALR